MRKSMHIFICLVLPFLLSGCGKKPIHNSNWNSSEMIVDGTFSDWEKELNSEPNGNDRIQRERKI